VKDPGPVFTALADPTRRAVLRAVAGRGTATATELTDDIDVTRQAVAKHLRVLTEAGLVAAERAGKEQRYRVTPAPFTDALAWMAEVGAAWDDRLGRLAARAAQR
jgi:DNA-binding transcriptional ArsR family regulator